MNRIDSLIAELCPEGVEFKALGEVASYIRGVTYRKSDERTNGAIRVLRANNITLLYNDVNFDDVKTIANTARVRGNQWLRANDILISAASGSKAHVGKVAYIYEDIEYCFGGFMAALRTSSSVDSRFLFHLLTGRSFSAYLEATLATSTINNLSASIMNAFSIPIPPLEVQREIVKVLDTFTELAAELAAELTARQRQYKYYRDALLSFGERKQSIARWMTLGEVTQKWYSGGTPTAGRKEYYDHGNIPWLRTQEVKFNDITDTELKITPAALENSAAKWIPENCVIIAISGATAGRSAINKIPLTTNQHCGCLEVDATKALYRYVFHWVSLNQDKLKSLGQGARGDLNSSIIRNFRIPVPPLAEQARIVAILDKFDTLSNSIGEGLPREIALRRQQYEHYRDRLLTFSQLRACPVVPQASQ